jgi:hypothetical protein
LSFFGTPYSLHDARTTAVDNSAARREILFTNGNEAGILATPEVKCSEPDRHIMNELELGAQIALLIFGIGGCVALAIVPWACIGTGLYKKDKSYQSY